ncbi:MAG: MarR family winged helix-turn-helix transcriptional regulator [Clostridiaceae bacterium]
MNKRIGRLIAVLYRKNQMFLSQALKPYGITTAEYPLLITLNYSDGVTQEEIAGRISMDKSAVARAIQTLESKELIIKNKDLKDQRSNRIYLTTKGREVIKPIDKTLDELNDLLMKDIDIDKREEIHLLLAQMVENHIIGQEKNDGRIKEK